jgi:hypothetical protein
MFCDMSKIDGATAMPTFDRIAVFTEFAWNIRENQRDGAERTT